MQAHGRFFMVRAGWVTALVIALATTTCLLLFQPVFATGTATGNPVWSTAESVNYGSGVATFKVIRVDLSNPKIQVVSAIAGDKVGQTATLAELVGGETDSDGTAIAGINGTFFNAYSDLQPTGTIIRNGDVLHISNSGSVIGVEWNNGIRIDAMYARIVGSTSGQWIWPYHWEAWNVNHWVPNPAAIMLFDGNYNGPKPVHDFTSIEVSENVVTKIGIGGFTVPANGFLILTKDKNTISKFHAGVTADYDFKYLINSYGDIKPPDQAPLDWENVKSAIGAGPILVKNSVVVVNPVKEHFTELKILTNKGQRSFVGVTAGKQLVMGSVPSVTVMELAVVAKKLGIVDAINLDGGASSATWMADMNALSGNAALVAGSYLKSPGRKISNALVVRLMNEIPVHVTLNGRQLFFDADPFKDSRYNRVLVPLRKIAESLDATVSYDVATRTILVTKGPTTAKLLVNDRNAVVSGVPVVMELPVIVRNGRSYVPARFLGDILGASVNWDGATNTVVFTNAR